MARYVALLRGINVGGHRSLPMADLKAIVASVGGTDVATYIQSGNVVFSHETPKQATLATMLEHAIEDAKGFDVPVVLRTGARLRHVVEHNPYPDAEPARLLVAFLEHPLADGIFESIDPQAFVPDRFEHHAEEIYMDLPNGIARSKLAVTIERSAKGSRTKRSATTVRNWRTVTKLLEMVGS